ncbi:6-bladed beta-propeller [Maribellus sediminis]|uniref:6-bladed beta-propeller n=1 Tax=Maribellus sediminis TaxID=2696285 RepID=UPI001430931F|nr:6-bladed beta-propeller [Maribellus sediminis]
MKIHPLLIALLIVYSGNCQPFIDKNSIDNKTLQHIKIPVNEYEEFTLSDAVYESKAIVLEFTKQSMIRFILQFKIVDQHIYLLDSFGMKTLLVFDMDGNYIRSIGSSGRGPGQIPYPKDFIIDKEKQEISVMGNMQFNRFSMDGQFKDGMKFDFSSRQFVRIGNHYFFSAPTMEDCLLYKTDEKLNKQDALLQKRPKSFQGDAFVAFTQKNDSEFFFRANTNDTIYAISENAIYPSRFIDFGKNKFNYDEYMKLSPGKRMNVFMKDDYPGQCFMNRFFETSDYLYVGYIFNKSQKAYILNKNTGNYLHYDSETINDDISYFNTPGKIPKVIGTYNDYFVFAMFPHEYSSAQDLGKFLNSFSKFKKSEIETMMLETSNPIHLIGEI